MPKRHRKSTRVLDKTKGLIAYCLDNCIKAIDTDRNPTGKTVAIFDLRGAYSPQLRLTDAAPLVLCVISQTSPGLCDLSCDAAGLTFDSMDRPVLQAVFDLLQNHYPERCYLTCPAHATAHTLKHDVKHSIA